MQLSIDFDRLKLKFFPEEEELSKISTYTQYLFKKRELRGIVKILHNGFNYELLVQAFNGREFDFSVSFQRPKYASIVKLFIEHIGDIE